MSLGVFQRLKDFFEEAYGFFLQFDVFARKGRAHLPFSDFSRTEVPTLFGGAVGRLGVSSATLSGYLSHCCTGVEKSHMVHVLDGACFSSYLLSFRNNIVGSG